MPVDVKLNKRIGAEIRSIREKKKMTTTSLSEAVGVSQAQISRLETGSQGLRMSVFFSICKALKVKPSQVLKRVEGAR